jgi:Bacterial Ig-like domain
MRNALNAPYSSGRSGINYVATRTSGVQRQKDQRMRANRRSAVANTLLFVGSALMLAGCGTTSSPPPPPPPPPSVAAQFNLAGIQQSPFPSDFFTVSDSGQNTALRVNLPKPDCNARPSDCQDIDVINKLDGFSVQTRLEIPFDGAIDPSTVNSSTVFFVSLGDVAALGVPGGHQVGVNQVVWDTATSTLFVESDELLEQHTRYVALVTTGVKDTLGRAVVPPAGFTQFLSPQFVPSDPQTAAYHVELVAALANNALGAVPSGSIAAATVFTTQSVTSFLEKVRDQIKAATPQPADFLIGTKGERTVFAKSGVSSIVFNYQAGTNPPFCTVGPVPTFCPFTLNLSPLDLVPSSVGTIAYGKYTSPDYQVAPAVIPDLPTLSGTPQVQKTADIYFTLFLPASTKPASGWPVAIYGHGGGGNKDLGGPIKLASIMAANGIATIAINTVSSGGGPLSNLVVTMGNSSVTLPSGGRTLDVNGDGIFTDQENFAAAAPNIIVSGRDTRRQTIADLMQLVRVIQVGVDVDGDGVADLDKSRVYYFGVSLGGNNGVVFLAMEPDVHAGVPNAFGGHAPDANRLSPGGRDFLGSVLFARTPSLLNQGPPDLVNGLFPFNENLPLRNQPPLINTVAGAIDIQEYFARMRWVEMSAAPAAYGPYLRREPLAGSSEKSLIMLISKGDMTEPNPDATSTLRAGQLAGQTTYFRNDLAFAANPNFSKDPHAFLLQVQAGTDPGVLEVAMEAQTQIAVFFSSGGKMVIDPDGPGLLFETPIAGPLPEVLNFIP